MKPTYREGEPDCSLWETDDGWELRIGAEVRELGKLDAADAVAALHAAQRPIINTKYRWVA